MFYQNVSEMAPEEPNPCAKIMQTSAMKACFQIAECSLASAKIRREIGMSK